MVYKNGVYLGLITSSDLLKKIKQYQQYLTSLVSTSQVAQQSIHSIHPSLLPNDDLSDDSSKNADNIIELLCNQ